MKPIKQDNREITICRDCGTPLLWTFRWAYKEYFCMNCGGTWGMMGAGISVEETPELKLKYRIVKRIWDSLYKGGLLLPVSRYTRKDCKKCEAGGDHNDHLTKREIRNNKIGERLLKHYLQIFKSL